MRSCAGCSSAGSPPRGSPLRASATGGALLRASQRRAVDALVVDIGLPDADGRDVCQALRARGVTAPVLFLTARDALPDRHLRVPRRRRRLRHEAVRARRGGRAAPGAPAPQRRRRCHDAAGLRLDPATHARRCRRRLVRADADRVPAARRARCAAGRGGRAGGARAQPAGRTARSSTTTRSTRTSRGSGASSASCRGRRRSRPSHGVGYRIG